MNLNVHTVVIAINGECTKDDKYCYYSIYYYFKHYQEESKTKTRVGEIRFRSEAAVSNLH
jgi:biotin synthase-like enzyme